MFIKIAIFYHALQDKHPELYISYALSSQIYVGESGDDWDNFHILINDFGYG